MDMGGTASYLGPVLQIRDAIANILLFLVICYKIVLLLITFNRKINPKN